MSKLTILGSSDAVPSVGHDNTHMILVGRDRRVLIDCGGGALLRLDKAGVAANEVTDLILTHFHPDHVSGVPLLLLDMWLLGRQDHLRVHGLGDVLDRIEKLMGLHGSDRWPGFFPLEYHRLPAQEGALVLEGGDFRILSSPMHHVVPSIGVRVEFGPASRVLAYSCDTEPCAELVRLAAGADVLIHEAAGATVGHSTAEQAGATAREAEVGRLVLIHYPTGNRAKGDLIAEARRAFHGEVVLAKDFMELDFG